ncbi:MAG: endonuclease domain-containing protein [Caldilineaceae bacterium]
MNQHRSSKLQSRRDASTPIIRAQAKDLRKRLTVAERQLWDRLRRKGLGLLKFRRQHPIGPFIVDFYCAERDLIVEIDGEIHHSQTASDAQRTQDLQRRGYRVIRFTNDQVLHHIDAVCAAILIECHKPR